MELIAAAVAGLVVGGAVGWIARGGAARREAERMLGELKEHLGRAVKADVGAALRASGDVLVGLADANFRGRAGGRGAMSDLARANPAYRVANVNAGMEIHEHRLAWIRH